MSINIIHISKTPLVGAPGNISHYLNCDEGFQSTHFMLNEYPGPLRGLFSKNSIKVDYDDSLVFRYFINKIKSADIVHIHNDIDDKTIELLSDYSGAAEFIYHVHSPLREPPLFCDVTERLPFDFKRKLCVAQVYPRLYDKYTMVPNIIPHNGVKNISNNQKLVILFSPTHKRTKNMRFGGKYSEGMSNFIDKIQLNENIELWQPEKPISPFALISIRENADISIDEIATGGFHQVSYEGLACGNAVINNSDYFSKQNFATAIGADELPPFVSVDDDSICEVIDHCLSDRIWLENIKKMSIEYYKKYMMPQKMVKIFEKIYME